MVVGGPAETAAAAGPCLGAAREREGEEVEGEEGCFAAASLPGDVGGGAARTAGLLEAGLVGDLEGGWCGLGKDGLGLRDVGGGDLKANAADEVGDLPVETHEVFVFEEAEDAGGFECAAGDDRFGEVAVLAEGSEVAVFGQERRVGLEKGEVSGGELGLERVLGIGGEGVPVGSEAAKFKFGEAAVKLRQGGVGGHAKGMLADGLLR